MFEENEYPEGQCLYIHTKKTPAIKSLIEALKEIFRDVSIKFTPKIEKEVTTPDGNVSKVTTGGMYITALNSNSNILVRLHLEASKFCAYHCVPEPNGKNYLTLGVNMSNLFKLIKFLNNDDELSIIYDKNSSNILNLQYNNKVKNVTTDYYLNLLDLEEDNIFIGRQKFDFVITMPSNDFHTLIKNMGVIAEQVDITFFFDDANNKFSLVFKCEGEFASQRSHFSGKANDQNGTMINVLKSTDSDEEEVEDVDKKPKSNSSIIQGVYALSALSLFSKCSSLCTNIELYIRNDSPLVIKYRVADMGSVHLILSPINNDDNLENNSDGNSSSEEENE